MRMFSMGKNGAKQWLHTSRGTKTDINEFEVWKKCFCNEEGWSETIKWLKLIIYALKYITSRCHRSGFFFNSYC